jgi:hypothetical protein
MALARFCLAHDLLDLFSTRSPAAERHKFRRLLPHHAGARISRWRRSRPSGSRADRQKAGQAHQRLKNRVGAGAAVKGSNAKISVPVA